MTWSIGLEDRGIVVTGGTGGIGKAIAGQFAAAGARVCVVDLDRADAAAVVAGLDRPARHLSVGVDLRDLTTHQATLEAALDAFGRFDVLVHAAAVLRRRASVEDVTEEDWDTQLDTNLKATFSLTVKRPVSCARKGTGGA